MDYCYIFGNSADLFPNSNHIVQEIKSSINIVLIRSIFDTCTSKSLEEIVLQFVSVLHSVKRNRQSKYHFVSRQKGYIK